MKILILYFSGTGNTWWVLNELKKKLEKNNSLDMYSIENKDFEIENIKNYEKLIIGYPVYGSAMPEIMEKFIKNLPIEKNKDTSIICTQAFFSGNADRYFKTELERKGYNLKRGFKLNVSSNFSIPGFKSKILRADELKNKRQELLDKLDFIEKKINEEKKYFDKTFFIKNILGNLQRWFFLKFSKKMSEKFLVNEDKCTICKFCINNCPVGNISMINDKISFSNKCILCWRCYNLCSQNAINYTEKTDDEEKYKRYKGIIAKLNIKDIRK